MGLGGPRPSGGWACPWHCSNGAGAGRGGCPPGGRDASTPGRNHAALPACCPRAAHLPRPVTPGLGHTPLCLVPHKRGLERKVMVLEGSGCGLRVLVSGRQQSRSGLARCPTPAACPTGVRAPPGPAPAAGQTARRHACWLGPTPSHVPPARTETGVGDFTEGIYCSELSCSQLFDGVHGVGASVSVTSVCPSTKEEG